MARGGRSKTPKRVSWAPRTARRERAAKRTTARAQRSDQEQLTLIQSRRGKSARERERLMNRLARRAIERNKAKTEEEIIQGGVAFITDTRFGGE